MTIFSHSILIEKTKPDECKGRFYRVRDSRYLSTRGRVVHTREFIPLKRKSCFGCEECGWIDDDLVEFKYNVLEEDGLCDGDIVTITTANISRDWESGWVDGYDLQFVKVKI